VAAKPKLFHILWKKFELFDRTLLSSTTVARKKVVLIINLKGATGFERFWLNRFSLKIQSVGDHILVQNRKDEAGTSSDFDIQEAK